MPEIDIFWAAKAGNLERVRELVEEQPELVNERSFDATALFYACLCGHYDVAQYLLDRGSSCAENTFEGDRCLYGALTDRIRQLLKRYSQRRTYVLSQYTSQINNMFTQQFQTDLNLEFPDGQLIKCHKFMLAARIPMFGRLFRKGGRWYKHRGPFRVRKSTSKAAYLALLRYCYSDVLECEIEHVDNLRRLCRRGLLPELDRAIELEMLLLGCKPSLRDPLGNANSKLVVSKLYPLGKERMAKDLGDGFVFMSDLSDCTLRCEDQRFRVHSLVLRGRSEYFRTLLSEETFHIFRDSDVLAAHPIPVVHACLMFMYTNGLGVEEILFSQSLKPEEEWLKEDSLVALFDLGAQCLMDSLCDFVVELVEKHAVVRANSVMDWLHFGIVHNNKKLLKYCFQIVGVSLEEFFLSGGHELISEVPAERSSEAQLAVDFKAFLESCDGGVEKRDFYIAEVREAFIESLPLGIDMTLKDKVTDSLEAFLGYQFTGAPQQQGDRAIFFTGYGRSTKSA